MSAPRLPAEALRIKGSALKNPKLFKDRRDPQADPLGPPSSWLQPEALCAWDCYVREVPWLMESDRQHLELASILRGRLMAGQDISVQAMNLLRLLGGQMGCNPADRSRIKFGPDEGQSEDPAEGYFQ